LSADHHQPGTPVQITTLLIPGQAVWYSALADRLPTIPQLTDSWTVFTKR
jgi:hypothetical protein